MSESVLIVFSSKSFIVSGLTFRCLIHFKFPFVCGIREGSNFILLHVTAQFSQHPYWRHCLLSIVSSCHRLIFKGWGNGRVSGSGRLSWGSTRSFLDFFLDFFFFICNFVKYSVLESLHLTLGVRVRMTLKRLTLWLWINPSFYFVSSRIFASPPLY